MRVNVVMQQIVRYRDPPKVEEQVEENKFVPKPYCPKIITNIGGNKIRLMDSFVLRELEIPNGVSYTAKPDVITFFVNDKEIGKAYSDDVVLHQWRANFSLSHYFDLENDFFGNAYKLLRDIFNKLGEVKK